MIQDIKKGTYSNAYRICDPCDGDIVYAFNKNQVLLNSGTLRPPKKEEMGDTKCRFLFRVEEKDRYLAGGTVQVPEGYEYMPVTVFRTMLPMEEAFSLITAYHLSNWYTSNVFCGKCGAKLGAGTTERSLVCPECGAVRYPTISPCVIVGVVDGDRIVLTRYRGRGGKAAALVAGFCEIGESLEDTVRREVFEETGLRVGRMRYYKSQPWGLSGTLLSGFFAALDGPDTIKMQEDELDIARWYKRDEIDVEDDHVALTREMIEYFRTNGVTI